MTPEMCDSLLHRDTAVICRNEREVFDLFRFLTAHGFLWRQGQDLNTFFEQSILPGWEDGLVVAVFCVHDAKRCSYILNTSEYVEDYAEKYEQSYEVFWFSGAADGVSSAVTDSDIMALFGGDSV